MPDDFGKWWKDLKKHQKRVNHWLPHAKDISRLITPARRNFRYLTLCARTMIDVFMMAKEDILAHDEDFGNISDVVFCEVDPNHFPEITEMLGIEGSGFFGKLEDLVLFHDDDYTAQFPEITHIEEELEREGENLSPDLQKRLDLKTRHLEFSQKFPRDFLNLDFCELYYLHPQDEPPVEIFQVNQTVERILTFQARPGLDEKGVYVIVDEFVMAITCRYDETLPDPAFVRLENIVSQNRADHAAYRDAVTELKGTDVVRNWRNEDSFDFFLASWPKDLLRTARDTGWRMEVIDYVYYDRPDDGRGPYKIVCLVGRFLRDANLPPYIDQAIRVLGTDSRVSISEIGRGSHLGQSLLSDLEGVVEVRNRRATRIGRENLPPP